ncbi:MAG: serine/threonine protein kinase [Deltaproteobacteria bacterium]|nr:serine/threonine protein kinase [Deltaproteobacteria bacterium]
MGGDDQRRGADVHADTLPSPALPRRGGVTPSEELAYGATLDPAATPRSDAEGEGPVAPGAMLGGRYRVRAMLGAGGMGAVYEAHDGLVDQAVALKFVNLALASDSRQRARLRGEVKLAQSVTHVNVARTYTLEESDGHLFIVMELLEGETLAARLRRGTPALQEALGIADGVLAALQAAHARGVVHRDIKPANVKLCKDGRVVVMDFGLARVAETPAQPLELGAAVTGSHTHTALGGTPGYIAPEIVQGGKGDERSDLYSLGVVLYELVVGRPPFRADTPLRLIREHVEQPVPEIAEGVAPAAVTALVRRLLAKAPGERFASASEVRDALARAGAAADAGAPAGVAAAAASGGLESARRGRRGWRLTLAGGGVLALGLAAVVWWKVSQGAGAGGGPPRVAPTVAPRAVPGAAPSAAARVSPSVSPSAAARVSPGVSPGPEPAIAASVSPSAASVSPGPEPGATPAIAASAAPSAAPVAASVAPGVAAGGEAGARGGKLRKVGKEAAGAPRGSAPPTASPSADPASSRRSGRLELEQE